MKVMIKVKHGVLIILAFCLLSCTKQSVPEPVISPKSLEDIKETPKVFKEKCLLSWYTVRIYGIGFYRYVLGFNENGQYTRIEKGSTRWDPTIYDIKYNNDGQITDIGNLAHYEWKDGLLISKNYSDYHHSYSYDASGNLEYSLYKKALSSTYDSTHYVYNSAGNCQEAMTYEVDKNNITPPIIREKAVYGSYDNNPNPFLQVSPVWNYNLPFANNYLSLSHEKDSNRDGVFSDYEKIKRTRTVTYNAHGYPATIVDDQVFGPSFAYTFYYICEGD